MSSTTRMLKTKDIAESDFSSIIVRLMMAINDTTIVNVLLKDWCTNNERMHKWRRSNGRLFLAKLQLAYMFEAFNIIREINKTEALVGHIEKLSEPARNAYQLMIAFTASTDYALLAEFRSSAAFHYDPKRASKAAKEIADENPADVQRASMGSDTIDWHFALADKAYERIVTRHIFKVPTDKDVAKESNAIANRFFDMSEALAVFGGPLIKQLTS
jgi:hypothetical protein